ncbi:ABC transporter ATP-binding protein [Brachybacterium squillarum]|uniref:ABC transporter ATP-binding protein n=1 Tax=Brachybacterium squillarum TaxID=661979 RepID=UPI002222ED66|nr:ATP-binding cassette domain-containing protein [Brachybacterium squillarum]MCW1805930.1 ATP-binding cassette domain-containing protein [Brachybacterium squillarum]
MSLHVEAQAPERGLDLVLDLPAGRTLALVGPNGAGKSSLLALLGGDLRPARGEVVLGGRVLTSVRPGGRTVQVPAHARRVATLGQEAHLIPHLTALGNVAFPLRARGVPRRDARARAHELLAEVGAADLAERRPGRLSGGQQQRVAIARALAADPELLLLDEPMSALDVDAAAEIRALLPRFLEGRSAVVVTHDVLDAITMAHDVLVLEGGEVRDHGPTADLLARPRTAFAARFAGLALLHGRAGAAPTAGGVAEGAGAVGPTGVPGTDQDAALRLPTGELIHGRRSGDLREGDPGLAALRPAAVTLAPSTGDRPAGTVLARTVTGLEPRGDLVRVRTADLEADLAPEAVAAGTLRPGSDVRLLVPRDAVTIYPAR